MRKAIMIIRMLKEDFDPPIYVVDDTLSALNNILGIKVGYLSKLFLYNSQYLYTNLKIFILVR